jgi:transposase
MVTVGVDAHKRTHTLVAVDGTGQRLRECSVSADPNGHIAALDWGRQWQQRRWAIEDCRHVSRRLEQSLLRAGEAVVRVPPRMTGVLRRVARTPGKSDPLAALAVARAAQQEPTLPVAELDGPTRVIRLLVDHRDDLVAERTRIQNRLRWHLHEVDPTAAPGPGTLDRLCTLVRVGLVVDQQEGVLAGILAWQLRACRELTMEINQLEREIARLVQMSSPTLLALPGCGALTAAKLVGETAGIRRFRSKDAFARHNGTAPLPVWSGDRTRFRLNRSGNRQLNCALHRIAITQLRCHQPAQMYVMKRRAAGKTARDAVRALRRQLSDEVYRRMLADEIHLHSAEKLT